MLQSLNRSQKFWNKERDEKELNRVHKFKSSCILLMNSHLTLSLKPIYSTPFPLITYICGRLYMELFLGKFSPTKILLMRCCQNKTSFSWSYRDSSKRSLENNVKSRREKRKIHTLGIGGHVQMANGDPEEQRKSSLSDCTWLESEYGSFNLEALEFQMHFREPGSSLYFIFTQLIFFSFSHIYIFSFSFLFFLPFLFFLNFFNLLPFWTLKLHCTYLLPHA
jgi:hypothetical protein